MKIYVLEGEPKAIIAGIAAATRKQESPAELVKYYKEHPKRAKSLCKKLKELGHYSAFELEKAIVFEEVSRLLTFITWIHVRPSYGIALGGLERSLRETPALETITNDSLTQELLDCYTGLLESKAPKEDARYILPVGTLTWIALKYDTRYLSKLLSVYKRIGLKEFQEAAKKLEGLLLINTDEDPLKAYDWDAMPSSEEYFNRDFFKRRIEGSMAMWHQLVRNRLVHVEIEGLYHARKNEMVIPPKLKGFEETLLELWSKAKESGNIYHFLIGQKLHGYISGGGIALDHFCQYRCCLRAQWEICKIAWKLKEEGAKYGLSLGPRCFKLGYCPEDQKDCAFYHFFETYSKKVSRIQR